MAKAKRSRPAQRPVAIPDDPAGWYRDPILWAITALAAILLLWNLGGRCLWEDEAETALLGRNILQFGRPVATDGINLISQEAGREFGADRVWRWSPWVQFYLGAAGLKAFGDTTTGARLPFAILSILVIPLLYLLARRVYESILVARFAAFALTFSVWFLLHGRQARWHAPAYVLACVILIAVFETRRSIVWTVVLALAGAALFYTNYFVAICFLVAIAVASPLLMWGGFSNPPGRVGGPVLHFIRLGSGLAGAALLSAPGIVFFNVLGKAGGGESSAWSQFWIYVVQFVTFLAPLPLLIIAAWSDRRPATRFLFALTVATCVMLAFAPWTMFRYLTILFPVAALLTGVALASLLRWNAVAGWIAVALLVLTSVLHRLPLGYMEVNGTRVADDTGAPFVAFIKELISPPRDQECLAADYLNAHATPGETVLITYGDLVLQFYTRMHVVGGLQGQPLTNDPDWIIARTFIISSEPGKDYSVLQHIKRNVDLKRYKLETSTPDPGIVGNPDPAFHTFREIPTAPPLRVLRRQHP